MNYPYVLCPHCHEFVDVIYDNYCANCGEQIEEDDDYDYDDVSYRIKDMEEYLADESNMRDYTILNCKLEDAKAMIICHQIDCDGRMNTPVAQGILAKNPKIRKEYNIIRSKVKSSDYMLSGYIGTHLGDDFYDYRVPGWCLSLMTFFEDEKFYGEDAANIPDWLLYAERLSDALENVAGIITGNEVAFPWAEESLYWDITLKLILKKLPYAKAIYFCKE